MEIAALNSKIDSVSKKFCLKADQDKIDFKKHNSDSYRKRMKALAVMKDDDKKNNWTFTKDVTWILLIFFLVIDMVGVIGKILMSRGEYEVNAEKIKNDLDIKNDNNSQLLRIAYRLDMDNKISYIKNIYSTNGSMNPDDLWRVVRSVLSLDTNVPSNNKSGMDFIFSDIIPALVAIVIFSIIADKEFDDKTISILTGIFSLGLIVYSAFINLKKILTNIDYHG